MGYHYIVYRGRTPPGVRGLKPARSNENAILARSHPTRGAWIETANMDTININLPSHPTRGAWIETSIPTLNFPDKPSHPTRGAWIETYNTASTSTQEQESHPTRGAWIETFGWCIASPIGTVAPHPGCVD